MRVLTLAVDLVSATLLLGSITAVAAVSQGEDMSMKHDSFSDDTRGEIDYELFGGPPPDRGAYNYPTPTYGGYGPPPPPPSTSKTSATSSTLGQFSASTNLPSIFSNSSLTSTFGAASTILSGIKSCARLL